MIVPCTVEEKTSPLFSSKGDHGTTASLKEPVKS